MTLVLFDIDGTLVLTGGAGVRAMDRTFARLYGTAGALDGIALAGRTDRVIVQEALARLAPATTLDESWLTRFRQVYCDFLVEEMANGARAGGRVLPGIASLLEALGRRADIAVALLTGNFAQAARIKLEHFNLWDHFPWGAFGDDHVDRNALMHVALATARARLETDVAADRVFVIGDTPHDVACARAGAARAIAVATGFSTIDELRDTGADVVFEDLSDTTEVLRVLEC
jgi:phosphoglycolate phosphatase-like HAD superfamily hydrolase